MPEKRAGGTSVAEQRRYTIDELLGDRRAELRASRPLIAGALALAGGKTEFTIDEARALIERFKSHKVGD